MATAARPPGSNEARVPCPLCGGLIHPIAGKCKHCKADLTSYRAQRPQAAAQLPALAHAHAVAAPPVIVAAAPPPVHANGHAPVSAPIPVPVAAPVAGAPPAPSPWAPPAAHQAYQTVVPAPAPATPSAPVQMAALHEAPVLPPRPSGMSWTHIQRQAPPRSAWRSWPMLVIILAMIAIVTAVVIMVWPTSSRASSDDKHGAGPTLLPDNKPSKDDPWGPTGAAPVPGDGNDVVVAQLTKHICDRVSQCGNVGSMSNLCGFIDHASDPLPAGCAAARRCFDHVDSLSCTATIDDPAALQALLMKVPDCIDAIHC